MGSGSEWGSRPRTDAQPVASSCASGRSTPRIVQSAAPLHDIGRWAGEVVLTGQNPETYSQVGGVRGVLLPLRAVEMALPVYVVRDMRADEALLQSSTGRVGPWGSFQLVALRQSKS
jgi:hypothetical protein